MDAEMKKIYWQSEIKNWGDELNSDHYETALKTDPNKLKENESILGIGSILDYDTSKHSKIHVLGTGSGYEKINIKNINSYNFWFVRGPLTAKAVGIDEKLGICDPAILIPEIYDHKPKNNQKSGALFIPHYFSEMNAEWKTACNLAQIKYCSPTSTLKEICTEIQSSNHVITESLHGAILADAYRIPWTLVATPPVHRSPFKWHDWLKTIDMEYSPIVLPWLWTNKISLKEKFVNRIKNQLAKNNIGPHRWINKRYKQDGKIEIEICSKILSEIKQNGTQRLSKDSKLESLRSQMKEKLNAFNEYVLR